MYGKSKHQISLDSVQQWEGKNACAMSPKTTNFESDNKFVFELIELYVFVKKTHCYFSQINLTFKTYIHTISIYMIGMEAYSLKISFPIYREACAS